MIVLIIATQLTLHPLYLPFHLTHLLTHSLCDLSQPFHLPIHLLIQLVHSIIKTLHSPVLLKQKVLLCIACPLHSLAMLNLLPYLLLCMLNIQQLSL